MAKACQVTGEVGAGKTMLCRCSWSACPSEVETIYLAVPQFRATKFLATIKTIWASRLTGCPPARSFIALQHGSSDLHAENKQVVALIDKRTQLLGHA